MMRNATRNDYDTISALIFDGDNHIGSACLLWSENKEQLYCVTADHCTHKDGMAYDVRIKYHDNGELKEYKIKGEKMYDSTNDVAIFEIEHPDNADTIPFTMTSDLLTPPKNCYVNGYPQKNKTVRSAISVVYISKNPDGRIHLNLPDMDVDGINRYEEIVGISGGGCYEVIENSIKFFGIENRALNKNVPFREVYCVPFSTINQLLITKKKPELPKPTPSYITRNIGGYISVSEALRKFSFNNRWTSISITEAIIKNVQSHFSNNISSTLFICGLSGIGKTRSVLMACTEKEFENTLYYENFSIFKKDIVNLKRYATETNEILNIVVDEAKLKDWNYVNDELFDSFDFFRIVLIGTISKNRYNNDNNLLYISTCVEDDVKKIIEAQYPLFTPEEVQSIYNLSYNDLRLAMLISRLHNDDKRQAMSANILTGRATQLHDIYSSAKAILERTIEQKKWDVPKDIELSYYFERLSLFVDIGFKDKAVGEVDALSDFFNEEKSKFKRAVDHLSNVDLGIKKEDYFEICPRALAKLAFEESGWDIVKYKLDEFMAFIPTDIMRRRFFDRVDECYMSEEVNEALASWFCQKYYKSDLEMLNYRNASEAMMFIEHNPEIGLQWLKTAVSNASDIELKSFGNGINTSRRHVVLTCEHLANFKEYFFDCEEILFRLAENECEKAISNNSQGIWSSYFSIMLANTEVSFYERYDILIKRAVECGDEKNIDIFKKAFSMAFVDGNIRWLPPKMVGGAITPPNWEPKTINDIIKAKRYVLNKLIESFGVFKSFMQKLVIETISENMQPFISYNMLLDYKETLEYILQSQSQKNLMILNIERQIRTLEYHNKDDKKMISCNIEILKQWIEELKDKTLMGRINEYLSRNIWSYGHTDEEKHKAEQLIRGICEEFYNLSDKLVTLKKIVAETNYDKQAMSSFAEHLAFFDESSDLFEIISYVSNEKLDNSFLRGYYLGAYRKNGILPEKMVNTLDEIAVINADFVLWASVVFDVSNNGYKRILSLLNISNSINCIENIKYKEWYSFLSLERKVELCKSLSNCENRLKYIICFELFQGWIQQGEKTSAIYELCIQIFEKSIAENASFEMYTIVELFKTFPMQYQNNVIRLMISLFDFNDSYSSINYYINDFIVLIINENNEKIILQYIGEKLIFSNQSLRGQAMRGFFDKFSLSAVKEWIEEKPLERAPLIAYHSASPNLSQRDFSELTKYLLTVYENDEKVYNNFILGGYNFVAYSPEDYYEKRDEWYELLKEYTKSPLVRVRQWAEYERKRIEEVCNDYRRQQSESSRYE